MLVSCVFPVGWMFWIVDYLTSVVFYGVGII